jgi:hypothetical protein
LALGLDAFFVVTRFGRSGPELMWWFSEATALWWPLLFLYVAVPLADYAEHYGLEG